MKSVWIQSALWAVLISLPVLCPAKTDRLSVFVSIPPQAWLLEQLAGSRLQVGTMLGPNANPHNYDPVPRQLVSLSEADLYFTIGVPFESMWRNRLAAVNTRMRFVHCGGDSDQHHDHSHDHDDHEHEDPHVWTSPPQASVIAECMYDALVSHDPDGSVVYRENLDRLQNTLHELDRYIRQRLAGIDQRYILVQHPAWDHFAEQYHFIQLAIEKHGHEPNARHLVKIIEQARALDLRKVYVQRQFSPAAARLVADAIDGRIIEADPMAYNYPQALRHLTDSLAEQ